MIIDEEIEIEELLKLVPVSYAKKRKKIKRYEPRKFHNTELHRAFVSGGSVNNTHRLSDDQLYFQIFQESGHYFEKSGRHLCNAICGIVDVIAEVFFH